MITKRKTPDSSSTFVPLIWGKHISGNPEGGPAHEIAMHINGMLVTVASFPLAIDAEDMQPDGKGGSVPFRSVKLSRRYMRALVERTAAALNAVDR